MTDRKTLQLRDPSETADTAPTFKKKGRGVKTIYTDRYGLIVWLAPIAAPVMFFAAWMKLQSANYFWAAFYSVLAVWAVVAGIRRFRQVRHAKQNGLDPTIVRVVEK